MVKISSISSALYERAILHSPVLKDVILVVGSVFFGCIVSGGIATHYLHSIIAYNLVGVGVVGMASAGSFFIIAAVLNGLRKKRELDSLYENDYLKRLEELIGKKELQPKETEGPPSLCHLEDKILQKILSSLSFEDQITMSMVSKRWNAIVYAHGSKLDKFAKVCRTEREEWLSCMPKKMWYLFPTPEEIITVPIESGIPFMQGIIGRFTRDSRLYGLFTNNGLPILKAMTDQGLGIAICIECQETEEIQMILLYWNREKCELLVDPLKGLNFLSRNFLKNNSTLLWLETLLSGDTCQGRVSAGQEPKTYALASLI